MAQVPTVLGTDQRWSPVLDTLKAEGYSTCIRFQKELRGRACMALGFGILKHLDVNYPKVRSFLDKQFRKAMVPKLVSVREKYPQSLDLHCSNPAFWQDIKQAVFDTLLQSSDLAPEKHSSLTQRGDLHIEDQILLQSVCNTLLLHLIFLQKIDDSYRERCTLHPASNTLGLVVVIYQENDWLCLLLHRDLSLATGEERIPFYLLRESTNPKRTIADRDVVEGVGRLTKALAAFIREEAAEQRSRLGPVLAAIDSFERFNSFAQRQFDFSEDLEAIKAAANLECEAGSHDITRCSRFNPDEVYERLPCGDMFHRSCIQQVMESAVERAKSTLALDFVCPICGLNVAESVIESLCERSYKELQTIKESFSQHVSSYNSTATSSQFYQSVDQTFACAACKQVRDQRFLYAFVYCPGNCQLCLECLRYAGQCPACWRKYLPHERQFIETALQQISYARASSY